MVPTVPNLALFRNGSNRGSGEVSGGDPFPGLAVSSAPEGGYGAPFLRDMGHAISLKLGVPP